MDKFEQQFENLDVQSSYMETAMSDTTTLTVPQVGHVVLLLLMYIVWFKKISMTMSTPSPLEIPI